MKVPGEPPASGATSMLKPSSEALSSFHDSDTDDVVLAVSVNPVGAAGIVCVSPMV